MATAATKSVACPTARKAVKFYAKRIAHWRAQSGAVHVSPIKRRLHGGGCPRYLAHVLQRKAYAMRAHHERLVEKQRREFERQVESVVRLLNRGLAGSPMAGTGEILERYGRRYGVSPFFMAATAATESSLGAAACSNNRYNVWGLASCTGSWYVPPFGSWDEAIAFYAKFLAGRWPGHSTPYSFTGYAACSPCWGRKVSEWMHTLFRVPAVTRYP